MYNPKEHDVLFSYLCILMLVTNVSLHTTDRGSRIKKKRE